MNKRLYILILILILAATTLSGCQLAKPQASETQEQDQLIGIYVTTEYVDTFEVGEITIKNGEPVIESTSGKLYASEYDPKIGTCEFDGYDGILFANNTYTDENGVVNTGVTQNAYVTDVNIAIYDSSESIEGTLIVGNRKVISLYMNPVYRTVDDQIYLMSGSGLSMDIDSGVSGNKTISESNTLTSDGHTTTNSFSVTMNYVCEEAIDLFRIKYINQEDALINTIDINPNSIPDELNLASDVAYLIVEQIQDDEVIKRSLIVDESYLSLHFFMDESVAKHYAIPINR